MTATWTVICEPVGRDRNGRTLTLPADTREAAIAETIRAYAFDLAIRHRRTARRKGWSVPPMADTIAGFADQIQVRSAELTQPATVTPTPPARRSNGPSPDALARARAARAERQARR